MNSYFTQSWTAIGNANEILESNVLHLIQEFDPPANLNVFLDDFLTALSTIFAVIKLPEGSVLSDTAAEGLSAVVHETAQLPIIGKYLFPSDGSLGDQIAQFGRIGNEASTIVQQYQENITLALHAINSNCDTFLAIANTTVFSNPPVSVQDLSNKILQILYVFIISQIMIANNIVVAMSPIPQWFTNPIDPITGLSSDWYVDTTSNMTYSMTNLADIRKNYTAVMTEVLTGYTTGPLLFQGAVACNGGRVSISGPQVSCLSSVQTCMYQQNQLPGPEFTNCPNQADFSTADCPGNSEGDSDTLRLPVGYIGAYSSVADTCSGPSDNDAVAEE